MDDLPFDLAIHEVGAGAWRPRGRSSLTLKEARDRFEQAYVLRALEHEDWNQSRAARRLGVHRNTLIARLAAWGIRTRRSRHVLRRGGPWIGESPIGRAGSGLA